MDCYEFLVIPPIFAIELSGGMETYLIFGYGKNSFRLLGRR